MRDTPHRLMAQAENRAEMADERIRELEAAIQEKDAEIRALRDAWRGDINAHQNALAADVLEMCKLRGWSLRWTERGAYLHLEASELIEAIRGKHGDPQKEAADVLLVLMSITENAGIPFSSVIETTRANVAELKTKPHYAGEEFAPPEKEESI